MRIFDEKDNEIESPDLTKGYLVDDSRFFMHHEAQEAVEECGHYEVIAEYANGGKDVDWIVDVPAVEAKEAWDEYESILRYIAYTDSEMRKKRISELKQKLNDTDYMVLKIAEGAAAVDEYAEQIEQRAAWRAEINIIEAEETADGT